MVFIHFQFLLILNIYGLRSLLFIYFVHFVLSIAYDYKRFHASGWPVNLEAREKLAKSGNFD